MALCERPRSSLRMRKITDLESVSRDEHLAMTVSTKLEVDTTIRCLVIALLLLIRYVTFVTLTFDLLTLVSGHT